MISIKVLFQNRNNVFEKWGGDTTQMVETRNNLLKLGVDVTINMETDPDLGDFDLVHIFNIQIEDFGLKQILKAKNEGLPVALSTIYWDFRYALNLKQVHLYSENPLIRNLAKINVNIPHYTSKLLFYRKNRNNLERIKLMLKESDILLPNSYSELEIMATLFRMPEIRQKAMIIPNGVSEQRIFNTNNTVMNEKSKLPSSYVLQVASFDIVKGQLNLIKSLIDYPEIPLVFIGTGLESAYGKECINLGQKRTNTYFLGKIPHEKIYKYYSNAKVHVLPSLRETPGLSTLEAAISGANCVISMHSPVTEYFGLNTLCCDPLDIESIQKNVLKAWNSPKSDELKNFILNNFTWKKAALKTLNAYKYILKNHKI